MEFTLGTELRDVVTGFKGIATGRLEYINGCVQYCLMPATKKDGSLPDGQYFDFQRLEKTGKSVTMPSREGGSDAQNRPPANYKG